MIKVGFLLKVTPNWMGELNYMKNLLYAINSIENKRIEAIVFISKNMDNTLRKEFSELAEVVESTLMERKSLHWFIWKICKKITGSDFMVEYYLRKYKIDVFSHSTIVNLKKSKSVNWIPDFQHLHLPEMFQNEEIIRRNRDFFRLAQKSDIIILSSYDALKDYTVFTKSKYHNAKVIQFVSQPGKYKTNIEEDISNLKCKYKIGSDYFMLPNQFWKHKNHMIVFKALTRLKNKGCNLTLVCTGHLDDYRNLEYAKQIKQYIIDNQIDVRILGLIDYEEMIILLKHSIAVINPSFFEGWSSIVEECKSLGKNMLLSDIAVHKEQNPSNSYYFNPNNVDDISDLLEYHVNNKKAVMKIFNELEFNVNIKNRTKEFAENYQSIIVDLFDSKTKYI